MKFRIFLSVIILLAFRISIAQTPVLSIADSSLRIFMGGRVKVTSLLSEKRTFPSGTAFLLLPEDATGQERSFDVNARASTLWFKMDGPRVGKMKLGGMMLFYLSANLTSEDYGILPSLLYVDLSNEKWRFAAGQQMDVFAERVPNMVDNFFALAISGCAGNSSRGQLRAERFLPTKSGGQFTITAALSEPITNYVSSDFRNNITDAGVPNVEGALRYSSAPDPDAWVDYNKFNLGISAVKGTYRVFKNDAAGNNIRVNKPDVWGLAAEYAFRAGKRFGVQGEFYKGQALGNYLGTIFQTTTGDFDDEIRSTGWWVEGAYYWKKNLQSRFGYGQDECNSDDLKGSGIKKNQTFFANVIWDINRIFQVGVEPTWRKTEYSSFRDNSGLGVMLAATLKF